MNYYLPYQNNPYIPYPYSLFFSNLHEYNLYQWIENHCPPQPLNQNDTNGVVYTKVQEREEKLRENIIIQPLQKYYITQHTTIDSNSGNRSENSNTKKPSQKEGRNVFSNLLRIFFKNILQLRTFTYLINRIISQNSMATSEEDFYIWLQRFGVNYKNYIKLAAVRKVVESGKRRDHVLIFNILLKTFISRSGKEHCLTSKRIDKNSIKMHLEGLRELSKAISASFS